MLTCESDFRSKKLEEKILLTIKKIYWTSIPRLQHVYRQCKIVEFR